jgi:hypothetical protein
MATATATRPQQAATRPNQAAARELALRIADLRPGVLQSELADQLRAATAIAPSTAIRLLRAMERDGMLAGALVGRRKAYRLPGHGHAASRDGASGNAASDSAAGSVSALERARSLPLLAAAIAAAALLVATFGRPERTFRDGGPPGAAHAIPPAAPQVASRAAPAASPGSTSLERMAGRREPAGADTRPRVRVATLSGVGVPGIAARTGRKLRRMGLRVGVVANAASPSPRSVVLYRRGSAREAAWIAERLRIRSRKPLDAANRALAGDAAVAVVLGGDRTR